MSEEKGVLMWAIYTPDYGIDCAAVELWEAWAFAMGTSTPDDIERLERAGYRAVRVRVSVEERDE